MLGSTMGTTADFEGATSSSRAARARPVIDRCSRSRTPRRARAARGGRAVRQDRAERARLELPRPLVANRDELGQALERPRRVVGPAMRRPQDVEPLREVLEIPRETEEVDRLTIDAWVLGLAVIALSESEPGPATLQPVYSPEVQSRTRSRSRLATCLWLLFIALALAIGGLLLPACSIRLPGTEWLWTWTAGCVSHAQNPLAEVIAQNHALQEALRGQQIALQSRDFCPAPQSQLASPPPNLPNLPPNVDVKAPVQVRLDWDSNDDLDLVVKCPSGGWISPLRQHLWDESCGDGRRDLDANYKMRKRDYPTTEHISWHDLRPGNYRVIVWPANTGSGNPIPFRVALTLFGQTQTCTGEVIWDNTRGEGYVAYIIDFDPSRPVPSCNPSPTAEGHLESCTTACGKE